MTTDNSTVSPIVISKASDCWREAARLKTPGRLWRGFWSEGELCCLTGEAGCGKARLATRVAAGIARRGHRVLYLDFELTAKQWQMQYTDPHTGAMPDFPDTLLRGSAPCGSDADMVGAVLQTIRTANAGQGIGVFIIDNINYLTAKASERARLIRGLVQLKNELGLSVMLLAHTPARSRRQQQPTLADTGVIKPLTDFFDSIVAVSSTPEPEETDVPTLTLLKSRAPQPAAPSAPSTPSDQPAQSPTPTPKPTLKRIQIGGRKIPIVSRPYGERHSSAPAFKCPRSIAPTQGEDIMTRVPRMQAGHCRPVAPMVSRLRW